MQLAQRQKVDGHNKKFLEKLILKCLGVSQCILRTHPEKLNT